jgi:peptidyl-prolyl cis-trans isomerase SurA
MKRNRTVLGLSLAAATIALGACGGDDSDSPKAGAAEEPTSQEPGAGAPEPDLEGIPDVVAEVNGEEVTKDEFVVVYKAQFQQATMQAQAGGDQPDEDALKEQTADDLVSTELLAQEAEARDITVTEQDVEDELSTLVEENQLGSVDKLFAALEKQGTSEDEARDQLESQMVIEQLVADEAGPIDPTEQELRTIYAQAKTQVGEGQKLPPYAKVRSQIVEQATSDEMAEVAQTLVDDLRKDADIVVNL